MSELSIIHGCIYGAFGGTKNFYVLYPLNLDVISKLPEEDEWPPLTQKLFSVPMDYKSPGFYRIQTIHFGASFNNLSDVWNIWLEKFETLIKHMYWQKVHLHLDMEMYGEYDYLWQTSSNVIHGFSKDLPQPVSDWSFSGGPRNFNEKA